MSSTSGCAAREEQILEPTPAIETQAERQPLAWGHVRASKRHLSPVVFHSLDRPISVRHAGPSSALLGLHRMVIFRAAILHRVCNG